MPRGTSGHSQKTDVQTLQPCQPRYLEELAEGAIHNFTDSFYLVQRSGLKGFPKEAGIFSFIQSALLEINTKTRIVAR